MGDAVITRRAGGDNGDNSLLAIVWGRATTQSNQMPSDWATFHESHDDAFFSYDSANGYLVAKKEMSVNIWPIVRGSYSSSGSSHTISYWLLKNGTTLQNVTGIQANTTNLPTTPVQTTLVKNDWISLRTVTTGTTLAMEAGFFVELQ